jgi:hypothetical protein
VTLVRRLLLRRLALTDRWNEAFEALRSDAVENHDADHGLYYAVALGEWGPVATELSRRLGPGAMPEWLDDLHRIAEAPARPLPSTELQVPRPAARAAGRRAQQVTSQRVVTSPDRAAQGLARPWISGASPQFVTVLHLLTALSVSRDPLCGGERSELYRRISEYYRELSEYPNLSCHELDMLQRRYRRLARDWHRVPVQRQPAAETSDRPAI